MRRWLVTAVATWSFGVVLMSLSPLIDDWNEWQAALWMVLHVIWMSILFVAAHSYGIVKAARGMTNVHDEKIIEAARKHDEKVLARRERQLEARRQEVGPR